MLRVKSSKYQDNLGSITTETGSSSLKVLGSLTCSEKWEEALIRVFLSSHIFCGLMHILLYAVKHLFLSQAVAVLERMFEWCSVWCVSFGCWFLFWWHVWCFLVLFFPYLI